MTFLRPRRFSIILIMPRTDGMDRCQVAARSTIGGWGAVTCKTIPSICKVPITRHRRRRRRHSVHRCAAAAAAVNNDARSAQGVSKRITSRKTRSSVHRKRARDA